MNIAEHNISYTSSSSEIHPPPLLLSFELRLELVAYKGKVAAARDVELRLRRHARQHARFRVLHEACNIMQTVQMIMRQYLRDGQPPDIYVLHLYERRMQSLLAAMAVLRSEEGPGLGLLEEI